MRRLLVVGMVIVAGLAAGTDTVYVDEQATRCWDCHAPGTGAHPMAPTFVIAPLAVAPRLGDQFSLQAQVVNTWLADHHAMYVTLDLRAAPSLAFVGTMSPVDEAFQGVVTAPAGTGLLEAQRASLEILVPPEATTLRLSLTPADGGPAGPDFRLRVHGTRSSTAVDEAGPGGAEVLHVASPAAIAAMGLGTWRIDAEMTPVSTSPAGLAPGTEWPFTLRLQAWGNASLERQQIALRPGPAVPGSSTLFEWPLLLRSNVLPGEQIVLVANTTIHYEHEAGDSDVDWDNMTIASASSVRPAPTGASMGFDVAGTIVVPATGVTVASISEAVGYAAAMLLVASMVTGGMFGKASRRHLNGIFGSARRRVAFHNFISYGIVAAALVHMVLFIADALEPQYPWQRGLIFGGLGILAMLGLGVTGAMQVPMIRRWDYRTWRTIHLGLALATLVLTVVHILLDGAHFGGVQETVGWEDPLVPRHRR